MSDFNYDVVSVDVQDSPMDVFLFSPEGDGPYPGIVLAQHIPVGHTGIENDTFTLTTAQRFANSGYVVAVPFIFHWWSKADSMDIKKNESRDDWIVLDIKAAFDLLCSQDFVDADRVAMVGHCWGGRVAWLAACYINQFKALAIFYGGNIKRWLGKGSTAPILLADNISCPVIGFFGNEDENPLPIDVDDYSAALSKADISHTFHQYDGAGHAFQNFPVQERYFKEASEDAWEKVVVFLNKQLA